MMGKCVLSHVAEELDIGLQTPVPLVLQQKFVLVKLSVESISTQRDGVRSNEMENFIPRVETTHVMVTGHTTVHNGCITLLRDGLLHFVHICPIGEAPVHRIDLTKLHLAAGIIPNSLLERLIELAVIEEHIWVMEPSVEMPLHVPKRLDHTGELFIPGKHHNHSVLSRLVGLWLEASRREWSVI
jgi:hypothetical protein